MEANSEISEDLLNEYNYNSLLAGPEYAKPPYPVPSYLTSENQASFQLKGREQQRSANQQTRTNESSPQKRVKNKRKLAEISDKPKRSSSRLQSLIGNSPDTTQTINKESSESKQLSKIDCSAKMKIRKTKESESSSSNLSKRNASESNVIQKDSKSDTEDNQESPDDQSGKYETRRDVLFKNVFRSVKKYYFTLFKANTKFFDIKKKTLRRKVAKAHIREFVQTQISQKQLGDMFSEFSLDMLCDYFGRILVPEYISKGNCSYDCKKYTDLLHQCIYNYSAKKASTLYKSKLISALFKHFYAGSHFEKMLDSDKTLNKYKELHLEKAKEVLEGFLIGE